MCSVENQVRVYEAVSRSINMTTAAETLHISEPTVLKQLKSLEEYCGAPLDRQGRSRSTGV
jgi:DNA-binding transcriptional LysR family regulator